MERLSKLVCENLMSRLWEGLWERIIMEEWNIGKNEEVKYCIAVMQFEEERISPESLKSGSPGYVRGNNALQKCNPGRG